MKLSELKRICDEVRVSTDTELGEWYAETEFHRLGFLKDSKFLGTFSPSRVKKMIELLQEAKEILQDISDNIGADDIWKGNNWLADYEKAFVAFVEKGE